MERSGTKTITTSLLFAGTKKSPVQCPVKQGHLTALTVSLWREIKSVLSGRTSPANSGTNLINQRKYQAVLVLQGCRIFDRLSLVEISCCTPANRLITMML